MIFDHGRYVMKNRHTILLLAIIGCVSLAVQAEELSPDQFDLFDSDRGKPKVVAPPPPPPKNPFLQAAKRQPPPPPRRNVPPPPQKDFTLRGISIIGSQKSVILQAVDGKQYLRRWLTTGPTPIQGIPGYEDYAILKIEPKEVHIRYPEKSPCRRNNEKVGIKCNPDGSAILGFMHRNPIIQAPPPSPTQAQNSEEDEDAEAKKARLKEVYKNFKRKVIKDEDVPPGMRVVRTPFGDRLVPDNTQK